MELQLLADSLYMTHRLRMSVYDEKGEMLSSVHKTDYEEEALALEREGFYFWLRDCWERRTSDYLLSEDPYAWTAIYCEDRLYVVGPVKTFLNFSREKKGAGERKNEKIPVLPMMEFIRLCGHIMHMISGKVTNSLDFLLNQRTDSLSIRDDVAYVGQLKDYSASQKAYRALQECVQNGDPSLLGRMELYHVFSPSLVAKGELRQAQNMFIISLTIVCHAAVSGGLPEEIAYPLSDEYMMRNESMKSVSEIWNLLRVCVLDYTQKVRNIRDMKRERVQYSSLVSQCRSYVMAHPMENLKIRKIAEELGVNPEYMARRFRKETGTSLLNFIHIMKIKDAKQLLKYSDMTAVEISTRLGFSSQSQFSTLFRRETGLTPKEFRNRHRMEKK